MCTIESFSDFKAVVAKVNESKFGLQAGVFTHDLQKARALRCDDPGSRAHGPNGNVTGGSPPRRRRSQAFYAYEHLEVGGVVINDVPSVRIDSMPYGGVKDSGIGREGIRYAIEDLTERRIMLLKAPAQL